MRLDYRTDLWAVMYAVDSTAVVIRDQDGAVSQEQQIDGPSPGTSLMKPTRCKYIVSNRSIAIQKHTGDPVADGLGSIP